MTLGRHCSFVPPYLLERIAASDSEAADHCRDDAGRRPGVPGRARSRTDDSDRTDRDRGGLGRPHGSKRLDPARQRGAHGRRPGLGRRLGRRGVRRHHRHPRRSIATPSPARRTTGRAPRSCSPSTTSRTTTTRSGTAPQLVFGDGDGKVFGSFTKPVDVLGHEFTHAVTQFTAGLTYQGQSGALNESVSDCFGICVKQRVLGQTAETADWLVGRGHLPAGHRRACPARHGPPRHGVRRPHARQGPPGRRHGATTSTPPTTTAASTPTPASPTVPSTSPPPRSAATPGRAPARSGTTR